MLRIGTAVVLAVLVFSGCGAGDRTPSDAQPGSTRAAKGATEESLRNSFRDYIKTIRAKDWSKAYLMMSPDYRARCSLDDFTRENVRALAFAGESFLKSDFSITNVVIEGNRATYNTTVDGKLLNPAKERAIYIKGRWYGDDDCVVSPTRRPAPTVAPR